MGPGTYSSSIHSVLWRDMLRTIPVESDYVNHDQSFEARIVSAVVSKTKIAGDELFESLWWAAGRALGAVASASRLHRVGRGFESLSAHHPAETSNSNFNLS